jgi:hypothetical protein
VSLTDKEKGFLSPKYFMKESAFDFKVAVGSPLPRSSSLTDIDTIEVCLKQKKLKQQKLTM